MPERLLRHQQPEPAEVLHVPDRLPEVPVLAEGVSSPLGGRAEKKGACPWEGPQVQEAGSSLQPNGYSCSDHTHCRSNCCVTNSYSPLRYCTPRTVFFQCLYWRKVRAQGVQGGWPRATPAGLQAPATPGASVSCIPPAQPGLLLGAQRVPQPVLPQSDGGHAPALHAPQRDPGPVPAASECGTGPAAGVGVWVWVWGRWTRRQKDTVRFQVRQGPSGHGADSSGEGQGRPGPGSIWGAGDSGLPPPQGWKPGRGPSPRAASPSTSHLLLEPSTG